MALENSQHVPSYIEYSHRDALVQQVDEIFQRLPIVAILQIIFDALCFHRYCFIQSLDHLFIIVFTHHYYYYYRRHRRC